MNLYLSTGLFFLYAGLVSLVGLMAEREKTMVIAVKRDWGRKRGLTLYFIVNIALPLIFGIVFFSRGAAGSGSGESSWGFTILPPIVTQQEIAPSTVGEPMVNSGFVAQYVSQVEAADYPPQDLAKKSPPPWMSLILPTRKPRREVLRQPSGSNQQL